jgi:hypothetical protein
LPRCPSIPTPREQQTIPSPTWNPWQVEKKYGQFALYFASGEALKNKMVFHLRAFHCYNTTTIFIWKNKAYKI